MSFADDVASLTGSIEAFNVRHKAFLLELLPIVANARDIAERIVAARPDLGETIDGMIDSLQSNAVVLGALTREAYERDAQLRTMRKEQRERGALSTMLIRFPPTGARS